MNSADLCRERGWGVGTCLVGDEGYGPCTIEITAIGERMVFAKCIHPHVERESIWNLFCREWKPVDSGSDSEASEDKPKFKVGDRVRHHTHGTGRITGLPDEHDQAQVVMDSDGAVLRIQAEKLTIVKSAPTETPADVVKPVMRASPDAIKRLNELNERSNSEQA